MMTRFPVFLISSTVSANLAAGTRTVMVTMSRVVPVLSLLLCCDSTTKPPLLSAIEATLFCDSSGESDSSVRSAFLTIFRSVGAVSICEFWVWARVAFGPMDRDVTSEPPPPPPDFVAIFSLDTGAALSIRPDRDSDVPPEMEGLGPFAARSPPHEIETAKRERAKNRKNFIVASRILILQFQNDLT